MNTEYQVVYERTSGSLYQQTTHPYTRLSLDTPEAFADAAELAAALPHGSGIDYIWTVTKDGPQWTISNAYHVMDEGVYVETVDFQAAVIRTSEGWELGELHVEPCSEDWAACFGLDDYLDETIATALDLAQEEA